MPIRVTTSEKKADIAKDIIVAYLGHMKEDDLADLEKVETAIAQLVDVVDRTFEVTERQTAAGFGMAPSIPAPGR